MIQRKQSVLTYLHMLPQPAGSNGDILVMLHGYGSNEKDLIQLAPFIDGTLQCISPRAPIELSPEMHGWFPIEFTDEGITVDRSAAITAAATLLDFIQHIIEEYEARGSKIWLMGFSQGAVMSYLAALAEPSLFHGVMAMSGQFPESSPLINRQPDAFRSIPFLVVHGLYDDVLPVANGRTSEAWLKNHVDSLTYREFSMGHEINNEALELLREWFGRAKNADAFS